ncbi:hypothetical protein FB451DRAFT_279254 [Mycena latifolia]|nr:hypothetical protein FB451DRAFT_279254 [Mycena latifolia]
MCSALIMLSLVLAVSARPSPFGPPSKGSPFRLSSLAKSASTKATATTATSAAATQTTAAPAPTDPSALQSSLTLDPSVICTAFSDDGQNPPVAGQSPSLTSTNNYINFCALTLPGTPLTNGEQISTGSCNPAPIGLIPDVNHMPSAKFTFPKNNAVIPANQDFTATLQVRQFKTGVFTNAVKTYFAAPQTLDPASGFIVGHSHFVIENLTAIDQIEPTDPTKPFFFKGVNDAGVNGLLSVDVTKGVPPGAYRICSINSSANHQPVIVPIAQHGSLDDCSYFTAQ